MEKPKNPKFRPKSEILPRWGKQGKRGKNSKQYEVYLNLFHFVYLNLFHVVQDKVKKKNFMYGEAVP